jgi:hypothetical protein
VIDGGAPLNDLLFAFVMISCRSFWAATSKAEVLSPYEFGNLMLHGQTRPINLRVVNTQLHYRETAVLQQTEFGDQANHCWRKYDQSEG